MFGRIVKWGVIFAFMIFIIIVGYAFLGDLSAPEKPVVKEIILDVD